MPIPPFRPRHNSLPQKPAISSAHPSPRVFESPKTRAHAIPRLHPDARKLHGALSEFPNAISVADFLRRHPAFFSLAEGVDLRSEMEFVAVETTLAILDRFQESGVARIPEALFVDFRAYLRGKRDFRDSALGLRAESTAAVRDYTVVTNLYRQTLWKTSEENAVLCSHPSKPDREFLLNFLRQNPHRSENVAQAAAELGVDLSQDPLFAASTLFHGHRVRAIRLSPEELAPDSRERQLFNRFSELAPVAAVDFLRRHPDLTMLEYGIRTDSETFAVDVASCVVNRLRRYHQDEIPQDFLEDLQAYQRGERDFRGRGSRLGEIPVESRLVYYTVTTRMLRRLRPSLSEERVNALVSVGESEGTINAEYYQNYWDDYPECREIVGGAAAELGFILDLQAPERPRDPRSEPAVPQALSPDQQAVYDRLKRLPGNYAVHDFCRRHPKLCVLTEKLRLSFDAMHTASVMFPMRFFKRGGMAGLLRDLDDYLAGKRDFRDSTLDGRDPKIRALTAYTLLTNLFEALYRSPDGCYILPKKPESAGWYIQNWVNQLSQWNAYRPVLQRDLNIFSLLMINDPVLAKGILAELSRSYPARQFMILAVAKSLGIELPS